METKIDGWSVDEADGRWWGSYVVYGTARVRVPIMSVSQPWTLAMDAFCDFLDRRREGRIPRGVETPEDLMRICVDAARRQR